MKLTAEDIVRAINNLPKNRSYHYVHEATQTILEIVNIKLPEGPIFIRRYNPSKGETPQLAKEESISPQMIWRVANAFIPDQPLNIDRILGASYNTRSALEALMAHTPQFYMCYPGRVEIIDLSEKIKKGHKHLLWCPNSPHKEGEVEEKKTEIIISEIPTQEVVYEGLNLPDEIASQKGLDIEVARRHAQIQLALIMIGQQLGFKTWVAQNDRGIVYKQKKIGEIDGVVANLKDSLVISNFNDAISAALLIDCIWFKNGRLMPAVMEIEHTTGVTSGLTRMLKLHDVMPPFPTRYVIVAADEDRHKVVSEINQKQFEPLNAKFFPYSAVEELWNLCTRRDIHKGVTEEFLDCYMEPVLKS